MQYRVCEKNPNSKIYNKLLFVCGDENIKSESINFPIFFLQIVSGSHDGRTSSLRAKNLEKGTFSTVMS